jgi:hypothetical protein
VESVAPRSFVKAILKTGVRGAAASGAAAALASLLQNGHAARPINAIAHIYDGGHPPPHDGNGRRNTLLGAGIHTAASVWWAAFYELALGLQRPERRWRTAGALSAVAYVVDYYVVSQRFRPGFEKYLSPGAMLAVYAALAAGYALSGNRPGKRGAIVGERQHQRKRAALPRLARQPQLAAEQAGQLAADR